LGGLGGGPVQGFVGGGGGVGGGPGPGFGGGGPGFGGGQAEKLRLQILAEIDKIKDPEKRVLVLYLYVSSMYSPRPAFPPMAAPPWHP